MLVYLEGKLTHRKWTDKEGRDHYSTEITADVLRILEKREYTAGVGSNTNSPSEEKKYESPNIETAELADDDLPF